MNAIPKPLTRDGRSALMRQQRRETILAAAVLIAQRLGWGSLTRDLVAVQAGVATGSVNHEFGTMDALRDAVMADAVKHKHLRVLAAGLVEGHPIAKAAPLELRQEAETFLT